ncbi:superoxide dismutase [Chitinophagaceae bacterium LB-8]|uniref:Superoxide dismutase n=1 Tax=Paraflavisolibacter caeni TaxID=2982496 RepID=A0A9X2XSU6_9BACT|nr:superoxide dismutase [Paraflavisolibacter caeni]MCU7547840.1 superoxide dismutase [Paraflavisolibacter caeni]
MAPLTTRRKFLMNSAKAGIGLSVGTSLLSSCSLVKKTSYGADKLITGFQQQPLPYSYNSLSDAIDGATMEIHYTKHAAGYSANLQDAAKSEGVNMTQPLEETLRRVSKYSAKLRNNAGGHYNHELFWKLLSPNGGGEPGGKLAKAINNSFHSFDSFKTQFSEAAKNCFGSGWAWLVVDGDHQLRIGSTSGQDNPLMDVSEFKGVPIMGLDVWEHAYYLRYQNKRADYINNWWRVVDWKFIEDRYNAVV